MKKRRICVIGAGHWGKNHIRTLYELGHLGGIVEANTERAKEIGEKYSCALLDLDEALKQKFDGYVVATPAETHYAIGRRLLNQGKHVLIEKPLTLSTKDAQELIDLAKKKKVNLMVGHLLLFHPAIVKIKEKIDQGKIGDLYYIYSNRLNLGTVRTEENVFWSFAPHDISVIGYLVGHPPIEVFAQGAKFLQDHIEDVTITKLTYPNNIHAHIFVSWLHPFKEQRLVIVGSKGMFSFTDSSIDKEILYYNKRIDWQKDRPFKVERPDEIIEYDKSSPLTNELNYFIENLDQKIQINDGRSGLLVVKVLEEAQKFLK